MLERLGAGKLFGPYCYCRGCGYMVMILTHSQAPRAPNSNTQSTITAGLTDGSLDQSGWIQSKPNSSKIKAYFYVFYW